MDDHLKQLLLLGREHYEQHEYGKAEYLLRQVVAKNESFADVHHMLGVIAHSRGDFVRAESHFQRAVKLNPNYTEAQLNLMVTYNELGKYDAAREVYVKVRELGGDSEQGDQFAKGKIANMHAEISSAYADLSMQAEAIRELEKAVELCPQFADLRTKLGVLLRDSGDRAAARQHFEAAKQVNPRYVPAITMLGVLLLGDQQPQDAAHEFETVLQLDPENKTAHMYLKLARSAIQSPSSSEP
jgi:Flp pilus assembly protein TadD